MIRAGVMVNIYKRSNKIIMSNMDDVVTKGFLKEVIEAFEQRLDRRFANLEAKMEVGFSDLNDRLDSEQAFTSDMWDDFSSRLAVLEAK